MGEIPVRKQVALPRKRIFCPVSIDLVLVLRTFSPEISFDVSRDFAVAGF